MTRRTSLTTGLVAAVAVAVTGWYGFEAGAAPEVTRFNAALATGVFAALTTVGLVGGWRRPTDRAPLRLLVAATALTVSYFRFLEPPWLATLGAAVWLASPAFVLSVLTEPARHGHPRSVRGWHAGLAVIAIATVVVSGPATSDTSATSRRAMSWVWFDSRRDVMIHQPNPLAVVPSDGAAIALAVAWWLSVAIVAFVVLSRVAGRWWRLVALLAVLDSVVLALPVRLDDEMFVLDGAFADLLVAVPMMCAGLYAARAVWTELITPRLVRPQALVLQLDRESTVEATRRRLATALGDPSAAIVFAADNGWVDESGRPLHEDRPDRRLVTVTRGGRPIAALDLDALTHVAPDLLADAAGSLVVSLEARRLAALANAAANEARQAARRLIAIDREAIEELKRQLEAGPQRTLSDVDSLLDVRPLPLADIHDALRRALAQVRSIANRALTPTVEQGA